MDPKYTIVCGNIVIQNNQILLIQEKQEKAYKKWWLPAGKLDPGETLTECAVREGKEETGYDMKLKKLLGIFNPVKNKPLFFIFISEIVSGEMTIDPDEILDIKWVPIDEIMKLDVRDPSLMQKILESVSKEEYYPINLIKDIGVVK